MPPPGRPKHGRVSGFANWSVARQPEGAGYRHTMSKHDSTPSDSHRGKDTGAVLALILAFVIPPVGLALAIYGRDGGRLAGLRVVAVAVGVVRTVLGTLALITLLGNAAAPSR
jgi:RsiW-degrading membrane proteinase PrsW (M82 family)